MQFVEERVERTTVEDVEYDNAGEVTSSGTALLLAYRDFCTENGYYPLGRNKFLTALSRHQIVPVDTTRSRAGRPNRRVKGWLCRLVGDEEVYKQGK